jgi:4-hydroxy-2-oxoheptanedioate aldolase
MLENSLKTRLRRGETVLSGWLHVASSFSAELMARQGFDVLVLDAQHGMLDFADAVSMVQGAQLGGARAMARVAGLDAGVIAKFLDAGCEGIICPMVNTRGDAEAFVRACRYPPLGARSYGPTRAALHYGSTYPEHANELVLTLAMIETAEGYVNLESILETPGLDGIFVGPGDLNQSLYGRSIIDSEAPEFLEILERIVVKTRERGLHAGLFCGGIAYAQRMVDMGFNFVNVSADSRLLAASASAVVNAFRASETKVGY